MRKQIKVLLVDDDEDEFLLTQDLLVNRVNTSSEISMVRFQLDWVATYQDALQYIQREEHDAYLVDYNLGGRDGLELLYELDARNRREPFIVLTGHGSYSLDVEAMRAGATDYLIKGEVTTQLLERTIRYAIERKRTEQEIRLHAVQAELLASLSQDFAAAGLGYPSILNTIVTRVAAAINDACVIHLLSEDGSWLEPLAVQHPQEQVLEAIKRHLAPIAVNSGEGPIGHAFAANHPLLVPNVSKAPENLKWPLNGVASSLLITPLRAHGQVIGTLAMLRLRKDRPYQEEDKGFFQDLADRAALAIENARLYRAESQRARELSALQKATAVLLSTIDLETLLVQILDAAQSAIPAAEKGTLHLIAPDTGKLQVRATTGFLDERIHKVRLPRNRGHIHQAVRDRRPMLINNFQEESGFSVKSMPEEMKDQISAVVAPLVLNNEVLGVVSLSSSQAQAFTDDDLRLLVSFATTTTAALQNALLHAEVQKLALTDSLTEVFNRRGFFELASREVERAHRFNRPLSVLMLDLDDFKSINDTYGHATGDLALRSVAHRLRHAVREVDIIGRYGGDEFVIMLPETDLFTACTVGERILNTLSEPLDFRAADDNEITLNISASMGVANVIANTTDLNTLLQRSDTAAYHAKRKGKRRLEIG